MGTATAPPGSSAAPAGCRAACRLVFDLVLDRPAVGFAAFRVPFRMLRPGFPHAVVPVVESGEWHVRLLPAGGWRGALGNMFEAVGGKKKK